LKEIAMKSIKCFLGLVLLFSSTTVVALSKVDEGRETILYNGFHLNGYKVPEIEFSARHKLVAISGNPQPLALANARGGPSYRLTSEDLFKALAKELPNESGVLVTNPHQLWHDVNPALPFIKIAVIGPAPTSPYYQSFVNNIMLRGCNSLAAIQTLKITNFNQYKQLCSSIRDDGQYTAVHNNEPLIVDRLESNPNVVGIISQKLYIRFTDYLKGVRLNGVKPDLQ
jgi:hypothetical protein